MHMKSTITADGWTATVTRTALKVEPTEGDNKTHSLVEAVLPSWDIRNLIASRRDLTFEQLERYLERIL